MYSIASYNYDYDTGDYDCCEDSYGDEEDEDYGGYKYSHDQDMDEKEDYYSKENMR